MNYKIIINKGIIAIITEYTTQYFDTFEEADAFIQSLS
jgi:hypothetical protein